MFRAKPTSAASIFIPKRSASNIYARVKYQATIRSLIGVIVLLKRSPQQAVVPEGFDTLGGRRTHAIGSPPPPSYSSTSSIDDHQNEAEFNKNYAKAPFSLGSQRARVAALPVYTGTIRRKCK
jgi:hypothetical protein